jgi:hypothetical protein
LSEEHAVNTNIDDEIAALRTQIAAAEQEIAARQAEAPAGPPEDAPSAGDTGLGELVEAHASMLTRLSRLLSCKRTLD